MSKGYLVCEKCKGFYELQEDDSVSNLILKCPDCGGKLKYKARFLTKNQQDTPTKTDEGKTNLFPCPDCGHKISPKATTCPNCGRKITSDDIPEEFKKPKAPMTLSQLIWIIIAITVFILIFDWLWSFLGWGSGVGAIIAWVILVGIVIINYFSDKDIKNHKKG